MGIKVFHKPSLFRGYMQVATEIIVCRFSDESYAVLPGVGRVHVPVSDELAGPPVSVKQVPCPNNGKLPVYGTFASGTFRVYERSMGEDATTFEKCSICGHFASYAGSAQARQVFTGQPTRGYVHPEKSYILRGHTIKTVSEATWSQNAFNVGPNPHDIIVWMKKRRLLKSSARKAANKMFRDADILHEEEKFIILQTRRTR